jgi:putative protein-disulfide isomerase
MIEIVNSMGLDGEEIVNEANGDVGHQLLKKDFAQVAKLGVRGFPTIIMVNEENKGVKIVGARPLEYYVSGLTQVLNEEEPKPRELPNLSFARKRKTSLLQGNRSNV